MVIGHGLQQLPQIDNQAGRDIIIPDPSTYFSYSGYVDSLELFTPDETVHLQVWRPLGKGYVRYCMGEVVNNISLGQVHVPN